MSDTVPSRRSFMLATAASVALLAGGRARADGQEPMLTVTGELLYRQRIALPDDAVAIVEIRPETAADGEPVTAETRQPLGGRQVPVAFRLEVPRAHLAAGTRYVVRGGIMVGSALRWLTEPVPLDAAADAVDLGTLMLSPHQAPPPFGLDGKDLLAGEWRIVEVGGHALAGDAGATLGFDADGTFSGRLCNSYRGVYTVEDGGISFGKAAATLMACPEPQATHERALFATFEAATAFRAAGDTLELVDADGRTLLRGGR